MRPSTGACKVAEDGFPNPEPFRTNKKRRRGTAWQSQGSGANAKRAALQKLQQAPVVELLEPHQNIV